MKTIYKYPNVIIALIFCLFSFSTFAQKSKQVTADLSSADALLKKKQFPETRDIYLKYPEKLTAPNIKLHDAKS